MWSTILNKKIWQGVFPNLAKDGSTYYVSATIFPLLNIYGEIVEFMALREDITKTIKYQHEIQAEKQRVSDILDNQESIIVLINSTDEVIEANKKFYEVFQFSSLDEFKSKYRCVCELFEEKENFLKKNTQDHIWLEPILNEPDKVHLTLINKRVYSVKVVVFTMQDTETYLATFTDITEIEEARVKSYEAEKEKSNFLANMSHEIRTPMNAILGFSQLLSKTELTSKQRQYVELVKSSSTTLIEIINDILDFSKLESGLTDIEFTKINPFMEFEDTFMLLSHRAKDKKLSYMIKIDHQLEECIEIDSFHIKQILLNLIGNAIKFTPDQGTRDIRIEKVTTDIKKLIRFSVQDTGIGIPKERQQKIFEPFSQADSSTTRQFGGTGLGLSISNSLVAMLGSSLQLESREGVGSKFYFDIKYESCESTNSLQEQLHLFNIYLFETNHLSKLNISNQLDAYNLKFKIINEFDTNIDKNRSIIISTNEPITKSFQHARVLLLSKTSNDYDDDRHHNVELFEEFPSILYNELMRFGVIDTDIQSNHDDKSLNLKILVAEDYEINRILISELLTQFGIDFTFAYNGQEAIEKVQKDTYDLILMDINMPIVNGMDATKIIINDLQIKVPIVALTANALEGDKEKFLSLGMVDYLSKPIDVMAFENLLIKYAKNISAKNISNKNLTTEQKVLKSDQNISFDIKASLDLASKKMNLPELIMKKLFNTFSDSLERLGQNIEKGIAEKDYEAILMSAHNIKSGAGSLCFDALSELSLELEVASKEKDENFNYALKFEEIKYYIKIILEWEN